MTPMYSFTIQQELDVIERGSLKTSSPLKLLMRVFNITLLGTNHQFFTRQFQLHNKYTDLS